MIDSHCHIDLYNNPNLIAQKAEKFNVRTIAVTNLPSHFEIGRIHLLSYRKVRIALGLHPLYADEHDKELPKFTKLMKKTSYIGEVGLDFSSKGIKTKDIQLKSFKFILESIKNENKILNLHTRGAEETVFRLLKEYNIKNAIFHWYTGSLTLIDKIIESGYFFSVNISMAKSQKGKRIIEKIPIDKLLTETDGPFISIKRKPIEPTDNKMLLFMLQEIRNIPAEIIERQIDKNFNNLLQRIKKLK